MTNIETDRLVIRELILADAPFVLELINEPAFIQFIGDKGVRDIPSAEKYLTEGPLASYARHGFGLWLVALKANDTPVGMCGFLKRDTLDHPDLGYAILARFAGRGYTFEAATAVLAHGKNALNLSRILAVTAQENSASIALLGKLGYTFDRLTTLPGQKESSRLFVPGAKSSLNPSSSLMQLPHPLAQLAGCCWFARHVAKTRVFLRSELPFAYRLAFGKRTGIDGYFFRHFGLNKTQMLTAIRARPADAAVAAWFLSQPGVTPDRIAAWNHFAPLLGVKGHPAYLTRLIVTPFLYPKARRQPVDGLFAAIAQDENLPPPQS